MVGKRNSPSVLEENDHNFRTSEIYFLDKLFKEKPFLISNESRTSYSINGGREIPCKETANTIVAGGTRCRDLGCSVTFPSV